MKLLWAVFWPKVGHLNRCLISTIDTNRECLYQYIKEQSSSDLYEFSSSSRAGISLEKLSSFHFFFDDLLFYSWRCFFFFSLSSHFTFLCWVFICGLFFVLVLMKKMKQKNVACILLMWIVLLSGEQKHCWNYCWCLQFCWLFAGQLKVEWEKKKCAHFLYISAVCSFIVWNFLVVDRKNCQREKRVKTGIETRHSIAALDIFFSKYLCTSLTILK